MAIQVNRELPLSKLGRYRPLVDGHGSDITTQLDRLAAFLPSQGLGHRRAWRLATIGSHNHDRCRCAIELEEEAPVIARDTASATGKPVGKRCRDRLARARAHAIGKDAEALAVTIGMLQGVPGKHRHALTRKGVPKDDAVLDARHESCPIGRIGTVADGTVQRSVQAHSPGVIRAKSKGAFLAVAGQAELGCARGRCACLLVCVAFENGWIKTAGLHEDPRGIDARSRASGSIHGNGASPNGDGSVSTTVDTVGVVKGGELMRLATGPFDHRRCLDFQIAVIQLHRRNLVAGIHGPGVTLEFARGRRKRLIGVVDEHAAVVEDGTPPRHVDPAGIELFELRVILVTLERHGEIANDEILAR